MHPALYALQQGGMPSSPGGVTSSMRTASPLEHVGQPQRGSPSISNTYHFEGITSPEAIAPKLTSAPVSQTRATWGTLA